MRLFKFCAFSILISTISFSVFAQNVNFEWAIGIGGLQSDDIRSIAVDDSGNVYITGSFSNTVDFDPGTSTSPITSAGASDIYLAKFTSSGQLKWVHSYGTVAADFSHLVLINDSSQIYIAGNMGPDIFIKKLSSGGNLIWTKTISGSGFKILTSGTLDQDDKLIIGGHFKGTIDFDPGSGMANLSSTGANSEDPFLLKFNSSGSMLWARSFGGSSVERINSMATDANSNIYLTGFFEGTSDFDPGIGVINKSSSGLSDIFLMKLDTNGATLWVRTIGGNMGDIASAIAVDSAGNSYLTGQFNGTVDFDPAAGVTNLSASFAPDAFFCKFSTAGNLAWAKDVGGTFTDWGFAVALDDSANAYFTGFYEFNNVDFDPGPGTYNLSSAGLIDAFILKLNASGDFKWAQSMGGQLEEIGTAIQVDKYGNIYTAGTKMGPGDYNPMSPVFNLTHNGSQDFFLQRLSQCKIAFDTLQIVSCNAIISPSKKYLWDSSGIYQDTVSNLSGCDSIFTIHLSIDSIDTRIIQNGMQLTAAEAGATSYQWLNCDSGYTPIPSASLQGFTPSANGSYAVAISAHGCTDTSACYAFNDVYLNEYELIKAISVFPNPSSGNFTIEWKRPIATAILTLYNTHGSEIKTEFIRTGNLTQFTIDSSPGFYFVKIAYPNGKIGSVKLMKE